MIELIEFFDGRYGLRNIHTGYVLTDRRGKVKSFKTPEKAGKYVEHINAKLAKTLARLTKNL